MGHPNFRIKKNKQMLELVTIQDRQPITTSKKVATKFNKEHSKVLRAVRNLECSKHFHEANFVLIENQAVTHSSAINPKEYIISRKGFTFLAMGFTGKQAAVFKEEYIERFEEMEKKLRELERQNLPQTFADALQLAANQQRLIQSQNKQLEIDKPKVEYHDLILTSTSTINTTTIAKELGMSAIELNKFLCEKRIQYKQERHYVLYAQYHNKGYTKTYTQSFTKKDGTIGTKRWTEWTEVGRLFIHGVV